MYRPRFKLPSIYNNENRRHLRWLLSAILLIAVFTGCTVPPQGTLPNTEMQPTDTPTTIPPTEVPVIDEELQAALVEAIKTEDIAEVQRLLDAGANPNHETNHVIPMIVAASKGNIEIVKLLAEHGGDLTVETASGKTPLDAAIASGQINGEFITGEITSPALANNLVDDPGTRSYLVYLPPSYAEGNKHYPVIYALHGGHSHDETEIQPIAVLLDWMSAYSGMPEMIIVFPNSQSVFGATYGNSPAVGDRETYITQDLINHIDANFRTIPNRDSRAITGCAPGGAAAIKYAFAHPDIYSVVAGLSGMYDPASDILWTSALRKFNGAPNDFAEYQTMDFDVRMRFAFAAEAAFNPDNPPFFLDMPYEKVDGNAQIVPEVAERINATYPVNVLSGLLDDYLNQPEKLSGIMLYHINGSPYLPVGHATALSDLLTQAGIEHEVFIDNTNEASCLKVAPVLEFFSEHLSFEMP